MVRKSGRAEVRFSNAGLRNWFYLLVLTVCWGSSFALTKIALDAFSPEWLVAMRLVLSAAMMVSFMLATGRGLPRLRFDTGLLSLALTGMALPFLLIAWGTVHIESALSGILMALTPLIILVLAHLALPDERMTWLKTLGVLAGFVGALIMIGPEALWSISSQGLAFWGQISVLGAAALYGVHAVITRKIHAADIVERTTGVCIISAVICVIYAALTAPADPAGITVKAWFAVIALALFSTVIGYAVLYRLLQLASAGFLGYVNYLIPSFALVLGAVAMGEFLPLKVHIGFALVLAGLMISEWGARRASSRAGGKQPSGDVLER
jgi:drug/metabolite transporter (DMT)-like permease